MAICHFHVGHIKRSAGQSAIASAAYRAGEKLHSEYYNTDSDYTRKGGVVHTEIMLPPHAPPEYADRQTLWNAVEKAERGKNAQLAYSFDIALQNELSIEENIALARQFLSEQFVSRGMTVDLAVHQPDRGNGGIPNPHIHVMCPTRPINEDGTWGNKQRREYMLDEQGERIRDAAGKYVFTAVRTTDWSSPETLETWRKAWADMCNARFADKGLDVRIDHRSFKRQGIDQIPTIHEGVAVRAMEKRGISTDKGDYNRWVRAVNAAIRGIQGKISQLRDWLKEAKEELAKPQPPTLISLLNAYYDQQNAGARYQSAKTKNLQEMVKTYNYLEKNGIRTLEQLESRVQSHSEKVDGLKNTMNKQAARSDELKDLLRMVQFYTEGKPIADKLASIKWKGKREKFEAENENPLRLYRMAKRKLEPHFKDGKLPISRWKKELESLTAEEPRGQLYSQYREIKADLDQLLSIKYRIERAAKTNERTREQAHQKDQKRKDDLTL